MITNDTIKILATKHHTTQLNILREYVQHLFLSYFYQQPKTEKIYFKGGTALRILYNSPRFSEDLDFSSSIRSTNVIEQIVIGTLAEIEREGFKTEIHEEKNTSGGYLAIIYFILNDQKISIQIGISLRSKGACGEVMTVVNDFIPPYTCVQLAHEKLVEEKMQALFSRKKPRDFYDFYFLIRGNLSPEKGGVDFSKVLDVLKKSDINFSRELKEFLPKNQWAVIRDFSDILEREVRRFV